MTHSFESPTASYDFSYDLSELRLVQADLKHSLSSDFALVQWALRRNLCDDRDAISSMRFVISRLEDVGSVLGFMDEIKKSLITQSKP